MKNMKGEKIVVTGGAGFIGSNLVKNLSKDNNVTVIDDLSSGNLDNIQDLIDEKKIDFIEGCITDLNLLKKTFKDVIYVFHLAAITSVQKSIKDPNLTQSINVDGLLNVLIASIDNNVKKVVNSSSCAVYGNPTKFPISENTITNPLSPYAKSKLIGEKHCQNFTKNHNLSTVSLRYFNVYGPGQDPNSEYAAVIPKFINLILDDKELIIYGSGEQTRDFVFVEDVVNANIIMAKNNVTGIFNVGSGKATSVNNLAKIIMKINGKKSNTKYEKARPGDILHSYADISKISKLNFKIDYDLELGLRKTNDWFFKMHH